MDFTLTPEQTLMRDSVERFVAEHYAFEQRVERERSIAGWSRDHWASFAELGWLGLPIPEAHGGFGGTAVDTMILMEAFGGGLVAEPFVPTVVLAGGILETASAESGAAEMLAEIVAGDRIVTLAYAEPHGGYDPRFVETSARRDGDVLVLDGRKIAVPYGAAAHTAIVSVRTAGASDAPDGITLVAVDLDAHGVTRRDYVTYDERRASDLTLEGVRVPVAAVISTLGEGLPALERAIDRAIAALCAEAVGAMGIVLRATIDYLKARNQFGRPIGSFQALQHRAVDMLIQLELARGMAAYVATEVDGDDPFARRNAAAAAKVQIGESSRFIAEQAVQLHGAIGLTDELFVGGYVKRLTMIGREFGDEGFFLKRYSLTEHLESGGFS
jgi:alkylation response protein AidB-like acyl-CoA dehydrogenase